MADSEKDREGLKVAVDDSEDVREEAVPDQVREVERVPDIVLETDSLMVRESDSVPEEVTLNDGDPE